MTKPTEQPLDPFREVMRLCPACLINGAGLADEECVVCCGEGVLKLGAAALSIYEPEVVSMAINIALERPLQARDDTALAASVEELRWAGVLHNPALAAA